MDAALAKTPGSDGTIKGSYLDRCSRDASAARAGALVYHEPYGGRSNSGDCKAFFPSVRVVDV